LRECRHRDEIGVNLTRSASISRDRRELRDDRRQFRDDRRQFRDDRPENDDRSRRFRENFPKSATNVVIVDDNVVTATPFSSP
jgi:hypothetical protein